MMSSMSLIFKIAGMGILVQTINTILETTGNKQYSMLVSLGGLILVMSIVVPEISELFKTVTTMFQLY